MTRLSRLATLLCLPTLGMTGQAAPADNLVPNSSFEVVSDGVPQGWRWEQGRADGELTIDEQTAHSGVRSVFIRNTTPLEPHVFSSLRTQVPVIPGRVYTLSCYVRGEDPGAAWVGGGKGWRIRMALPKGDDRWRRLSTTFTTQPDETLLDIIINTDSPTEGFWVDSVQLEEGEEAGEYQGPLAPGEMRILLETGARAGVGDNLIPNASFEIVDGNRPKHWTWDKRNTDATFEVVSAARSGKSAIRITNNTPHGPHVYGQVVLVGGVPLIPGETYTLSLYARSEDPGAAWLGGGTGWWMRISLGKTGGEWRRFSRSFTARDGDENFALMINTDSPTEGFIVDDIKLEKGEAATPFIDPTTIDRAVELVMDVPQVLSCNSTELSLTGFAWLRDDAATTPVVATLSTNDGEVCATATTTGSLKPGLNRLVINWAHPARPAARYRLTLLVGETRFTAPFELFTAPHFAQASKDARRSLAALGGIIDQAANAGVPADYARAAAVIARRFLEVAARKRDANLIPEALADAETIAALCDKQAARLREIIDGARPAFAIPDPPLDRIQIRDGNFWVDDQPVMLLGGMGYGDLQRDLDTYRDYGFNVVGDDFNSFSAFRMMTGEEEFDETAIPRLLENWEQMRAMNLAVAYNPTLHYFPTWAFDKYPDITGGDPVQGAPDWGGQAAHKGKRTKSYGGFFPFAIDSPNLRRLVSRYFAKLMPALKDNPLFHVIWLMNEPTYHSRDPHYIALFQQHLRAKFGGIEELNAAWGSEHESFAQIGYPTTPGAPAKFDWLTFHQDQVASWFEWLAAEIKQHCPRALLSSKPMAWTLLDPEGGIDFEREAELWEVPGCDAMRNPTSATYSFAWAGASMLFDFQKSVAPDKPLGDHEYHYVHWPNVSSEYVRATYFHSYLHGLRMSEFWVWSTGTLGPGRAGAGMKHTAWSQPKVAWGTATAALDLRRLAPYIAAFPGKPEVMIYISRPSLYVDHTTHKSMILRAYAAANCLDAPVGFLTDKMIRSGKAAGRRVLIVPAAAHVEADVLAGIQTYVDDGGFVVLIGECLTKDEYGRRHKTTLSARASQTRKPKSVATADLVMSFEEAFTAARVSRPLRALLEDGKPAWPVECRSARVGEERVCYLVGLNKETMAIRLAGDRSIRGWEDLITGERGVGNQLEVKPLDVRLLRLR